MSAHLELLTRVLVDEGGANDGQLGDLCRKRDRAGSARVRAAGGVDDLVRRLVQDSMVVSLEPDPNFLRHCWSLILSLSICPLLEDLGDHAGTDGLAAFADGEPEPLLD